MLLLFNHLLKSNNTIAMHCFDLGNGVRVEWRRSRQEKELVRFQSKIRLFVPNVTDN